MQGTSHVRSLIRLFIGAVLLCLAWLVLTSGQASAAERPAPAQPLADLGKAVPLVDGSGLDSLVGGLLPKPSEPVERPTRPSPSAADKAKHHASRQPEKRSHTTQSKPQPRLTRPVEEVADTVRSTVDTGLTLVGDVAAITRDVPVVGAPVVGITDAVDSVVGSLPVLGESSPVVPLPIGGGIVSDEPGLATAPVTEPVAGEAVRQTREAVPVTPAERAMAHEAPAAAPERAVAPVRVVGSTRPDAPSLPAGPGAPLDALPAPPTQPSPGGSGPGALDPVTTSQHLPLAELISSVRLDADWRLPCGPCAQPGTRPD